MERRVRVVVRLVERLGRVREAAARPGDARDEPRREVARPLEQRGPPVREPPRAAAREHERRPRRAAGLGRGGVRSDAALGDLGEDSGVPGPRAAARRHGVDAGQARREPSPRARRRGVRGRRRRARLRVRRPQRLELGVVAGAREPAAAAASRTSHAARAPSRLRTRPRAPTERARAPPPAPSARRAAARPCRRARRHAPVSSQRAAHATALDRVAGLGRRVQGRRRHVRPARRAVAAAVGHSVASAVQHAMPPRWPSANASSRAVGERAAAAASARAHCDRAASAQFGAAHTESAVSQCSCGSAPRLAAARRAEDAKTETSARPAAHARASKSKRCAGDALL